MAQTYTSANTSINKGKVPAIFRKIRWRDGVNLDLGGGKFDTATDYLWDNHGIINLIIDPYNRSAEENESNENLITLWGGADSCTISNVLNVIDSAEARLVLLLKARRDLKPLAPIYISVYEGDRSGIGRQTGHDQWQNNRRLRDYLGEVLEVFPDAVIRNGMICATKAPW